MPKFVFDPKKEIELRGLLDILIHSEAVHCKAAAPEVIFSGLYSYLLHGYDHQVTVDFNKMAKALYDAGYQKGEKLDMVSFCHYQRLCNNPLVWRIQRLLFRERRS